MADVEVLRYSAFPEGDRGGNPAGVVLRADALDEAARLSIAADVGYSETAFVEEGDERGRYVVRYFSPRAEVAFCGHATIAAAVALVERGAGPALRFDTLAGEVPLATTRAEGEVTATLTSVPTRTRPMTATEQRALLRCLGWSAEDLDPRYPAHVGYAGNDHPILAVRERATLAQLDYEYAGLAALMTTAGWTTVHLVWAESRHTFRARDPFPPGGVVEDPATGAAAAAFGGYLRDLGLVDPPARITVLQGEDMGRPSRLVVDVVPGTATVRVTGGARPIAPAPAP